MSDTYQELSGDLIISGKKVQKPWQITQLSDLVELVHLSGWQLEVAKAKNRP